MVPGINVGGESITGKEWLTAVTRSEDGTKLLSRQTGMQRGKQRESRESSCTCRLLAVDGADESGSCRTKIRKLFVQIIWTRGGHLKGIDPANSGWLWLVGDISLFEDGRI